MSTINPANNLQFKSVDSMFARIRKRLNSYDAAGILDEGDWYYYIKEVVDSLGVSVYEESQAIVQICDYKGTLPENFSYLYSAYKCTPNMESGSKNTLFPQTGFVFYIEDTYEPYRKCKNCYAAKIDYVDGAKFTTRTYIEGQPHILNFTNPTLLRLSGNARNLCDTKCANLFSKSAHEITIDKHNIYTNFKNDCVLMKYYGLALDLETGLPMIPDNTIVEKAIEAYIIYRVFEDFILNSSVPGVEDKYKLVRGNYEELIKEAMYWCKLPTFQAAIGYIRQQRKNLRVYQQLEWS